MSRPEIVCVFKESQAEYRNTGRLYQTTYYVDDSHVNGLKGGFLTALKGDGDTQGKKAATLTYASADGKAAKGVVSEVSHRDPYGRTDDMTNEVFLYPYGKREDTRIGLVKEAVLNVTIRRQPKKMYFFITDTSITLSGDGTDVAHYGNHAEQIKEGVVLVDGGTKHTVKSVSEAGVVAFDVAPVGWAADKVVVAECELAKPIFLNKIELDLAGKPKAHVTPFTLLENTTSGEINQVVGEVASGRAVMINLNYDNAPAVNA